ncbi:hypothetical protein GCM10023186_26860 [Hymenobacter koreensis]|uniref:Uncharacterized protein n=1 Tax=Hymenobacter koreensis TaxID=1084523 RepID=A0ABP8J3T2_9BACT
MQLNRVEKGTLRVAGHALPRLPAVAAEYVGKTARTTLEIKTTPSRHQV